MGSKSTGNQFFDHLSLIKWLGEYDGPPLTTDEIAHQMQMHPVTARQNMTILERLGMARQQKDPKDSRRSQWVSLYNITQREATNSPEDSYLNSRGLTAAGTGS